MLATIHNDTRNVLNIQCIIPNSKRWDYSDTPDGGQCIIPNSKRWDYSDTPGGGHKKIQRPAQKYSGSIRPIPWKLMPWTLASLDHQQPRWWLCWTKSVSNKPQQHNTDGRAILRMYSISMGCDFLPKPHTASHDDVIKWKNSPHKGQWRGSLMFSIICTRIDGWVNYREAGDLRRHHAHYDVIVTRHRLRIQITYLYISHLPLPPICKFHTDLCRHAYIQFL